ncbi:MAG: sigma-70 family RNA polymerase sigma factor [Candidatus Riflebacteria bacterium]|nr:sigma-70 family RNA polymerase sigma factor [Candidatus Riflebacteria bacterium]
MPTHDPFDVVSELRVDFESYLRRRLPGLRQDHDDIIGRAIEDLLRYVQGLHDSPAEPTATDLRSIGFAILKRRVFDALRRHLSRQSRECSLDSDQAPVAQLDVERIVWRKQVVMSVLDALSRLDDGDREVLIERIFPATDVPVVATPAERQRLHRARRRLMELLATSVGSDAFGD